MSELSYRWTISAVGGYTSVISIVPPFFIILNFKLNVIPGWLEPPSRRFRSCCSATELWNHYFVAHLGIEPSWQDRKSCILTDIWMGLILTCLSFEEHGFKDLSVLGFKEDSNLYLGLHAHALPIMLLNKPLFLRCRHCISIEETLFQIL